MQTTSFREGRGGEVPRLWPPPQWQGSPRHAPKRPRTEPSESRLSAENVHFLIPWRGVSSPLPNKEGRAAAGQGEASRVPLVAGLSFPLAKRPLGRPNRQNHPNFNLRQLVLGGIKTDCSDQRLIFQRCSEIYTVIYCR